MTILKYQTFVFDCDGVVLNSNKVKTEAFFKTALPYGEAAARQLVQYHVERGGISRYKKFEWFLQSVVAEQNGPSLQELLATYAAEVRKDLLTCSIAEGLAELRDNTPNANWLIVSGGDQQELRDVFAERDIARHFNGGIFGSPDSKKTILAREIKNFNIKYPAIFIGDSQYDYEVSIEEKMDFIFLTEWSEFSGWADFFEGKSVDIRKNINAIISN